MNLARSWTVASKDFAVVRRKPSILYPLFAFPMAIGTGFPLILELVAHRRGVSFASLVPLTDAFAFFFVICGVVLASTLASYAIVGEKVEKSLEPLLATPATDSEIFLGKMLSAFVPTVGATLLGSIIFMGLFDAFSAPQLGYIVYPDVTIAVVVLVAMPLSCLLGVEADILISTRATDVRAAQQMGAILVLPFAGLYVAGEVNAITLDTPTLLIVSGVLAVGAVGLFFASRSVFHREDILTRWK